MPENCPAPHRDGRDRTPAPGLRLCHGCRQRLGTAIAAMPDLDLDLELALIRADNTQSEPITHRKDPGLVLNQAALEARIAIRQELVATVRMVNEERGLSTWPKESTPGMVGYLMRHVDWLAAHEAAEDWVMEWTDLQRQARRAAHPSGIRRFELAPCIEVDCGGILIAILRPSDDLLPSSISCDANAQHQWQPREWIALGRRIHGTPHANLLRTIVA